MNLMEARDVSKTYRRGGLFGRHEVIEAVKNVTLAIRAGTCMALAGASGSGKSTLGRLILGLEHPDSGEVFFKGKPVSQLRGKERLNARRSVQAVFQNSQGAVNPRFTARDIIAEPLVNFEAMKKKVADLRVGELLEEVGLAAADMHKYPHQFSGGELQRICFARALAPRPELVVLDEAVSSLDMLNQSRMLGIIEQVRDERGTAFLFITHDMRVVAACANGLAVMNKGKLVMCADEVDELARGTLPECPEYGDLISSVLPRCGTA